MQRPAVYCKKKFTISANRQSSIGTSRTRCGRTNRGSIYHNFSARAFDSLSKTRNNSSSAVPRIDAIRQILSMGWGQPKHEFIDNFGAVVSAEVTVFSSDSETPA